LKYYGDATAADRTHLFAIGVERREVDRRPVGLGVVQPDLAAHDLRNLRQDIHDAL